MARGLLPSFKRFHDEADVYVTESSDNGIGYEDHKQFNLDEGHKVEAPSLWDVLSGAGLRTWVCGSMNPRVGAGFDGAILPDPWSTHVEPQPKELGAFFKFIQRNVQEHTKEKVPLGARDYAEFIGFIARHGLSRKTGIAIARQLLDEKKTGGKSRWRRATILDRLQLDVFRHYWETLNPHFATFFSNSTAHFQHMHWRNMEPSLFEVAPSEAEQLQYSDAIEYGYRSMDRLVGDFIELAGKDTTLVFLTALSQQPYLLSEQQGGKVTYRPKDFRAIVEWAGVEGKFTTSPVMTHYFHVRFEDEATAQAAAAKLRALTADGSTVFNVEDNGRELFCGCHLYKQLAPDLRIASSATGRSGSFFDHLYRIEGMKSGMHHADGLLWVRTPSRRHAVHADKVPLERVAPMILDMFSIPAPPSMRAPALEGFAAVAAP